MVIIKKLITVNT
ncbi:hypothetical protein FWK35_00023675 [Aphis craccivora]|uniref:Uncharacterized protein n=1 Tax=Aphis craccivora TaxID=307492 RepID=A0A6G0ZGW0_APHCR|nr:hypothetical protein FWK35_00023675 [Aphis craccivora]